MITKMVIKMSINGARFYIDSNKIDQYKYINIIFSD